MNGIQYVNTYTYVYLERNIFLSLPHPSEIYFSTFSPCRGHHRPGGMASSPCRLPYDQPRRGWLLLRDKLGPGGQPDRPGLDTGQINQKDPRDKRNLILLQKRKKKEGKPVWEPQGFATLTALI